MTQEELYRILDYNSATGIFTYKVSTNPKTIVGQIAGTANRAGYLHIGYKGKKYSLHRLAFLFQTGTIPRYVDHINRNTKDNRWNNLRACTPTQNRYNSGIGSNNTSGTKGVTYNKRDRNWKVQLHINGINTHLGYFSNKEEAVMVSQQARIKEHKEFAHG